MPPQPHKLCAWPGCNAVVRGGQTYCPSHQNSHQKKRAEEWKRRAKKRADTRRSPAERGYDADWRALRKQFLRENSRCCVCGQKASHVDHIIPIVEDPTKRLDRNNLRAMCAAHHNQRTAREQVNAASSPSKVTFEPPLCAVTVVSGPPGSGKTTYAQANASERDHVIDLDVIKARLSGLPMYQAGDEWLMPALRERNRQLANLSRRTDIRRCWFIVGAPSVIDRRKWAQKLRADVVLLLPSKEICEQRIRRDKRRDHDVARQLAACSQWYEVFIRGDDDVIIGA